MDRTHPTRRAERALDAGLDYARQVAGGDLAAHPWTRAAAHRFEHDIAEAEAGGRWVFDRDHALRPIAFAAEMLKVEGARMILTPWQSWITAAIFGFVDGERGVRRIRQAVILAGDPAAHVALVAALALSAVFCEGGKSSCRPHRTQRTARGRPPGRHARRDRRRGSPPAGFAGRHVRHRRSRKWRR